MAINLAYFSINNTQCTWSIKGKYKRRRLEERVLDTAIGSWGNLNFY